MISAVDKYNNNNNSCNLQMYTNLKKGKTQRIKNYRRDRVVWLCFFNLVL